MVEFVDRAFRGNAPALVQCFIEDTFLAEFGTAGAWKYARTLSREFTSRIRMTSMY